MKNIAVVVDTGSLRYIHSITAGRVDEAENDLYCGVALGKVGEFLQTWKARFYACGVQVPLKKLAPRFDYIYWCSPNGELTAYELMEKGFKKQYTVKPSRENPVLPSTRSL